MAPAKPNPPGDDFEQTRRHMCVRAAGRRRQPARHEIDFCAYLSDPAYREAHEVTLADDCVVLDAVSQIGPGELWVTAQIVVELTP